MSIRSFALLGRVPLHLPLTPYPLPLTPHPSPLTRNRSPPPPQLDPAVDGGQLERPAALADPPVELVALHPALHGDRVVGTDAAVDRAGLELGRVARRDRQRHAAVGRLHLEALAVPLRAVEPDGDAAVARRADDPAADFVQRDAAANRGQFTISITGSDAVWVGRLKRNL